MTIRNSRRRISVLNQIIRIAGRQVTSVLDETLQQEIRLDAQFHPSASAASPSSQPIRLTVTVNVSNYWPWENGKACKTVTQFYFSHYNIVVCRILILIIQVGLDAS